MGIFMTFTAVGALISFNAVPRIVTAVNWQFVWYAIAVLATIECVLLLLFLQVPPISPTNDDKQTTPSLFSGFKIGRAWLLAIAQGCIVFILFAYFTLYPLIFQNYYHLEFYKANQIVSYSGLFGIFTCIFSGYLVTKTGKAALINVVAFIALIAINATTFYLGTSTAIYILHVLGTSICVGLVIAATLTLPSSITKDPTEIGTIVAMTNFVYFVGIAIGSPIVVAFSQSGTSQQGAIPLVVTATLGLAVSLIFLLTMHKVNPKAYG